MEAVVWDWSGTLSDDRKPVHEAYMRVLEGFNKPRISFEQWLPTSNVNVVNALLEDHGITGDPAHLTGLFKTHFETVNAEGVVPSVYPYAREILEHLNDMGVTIAVVSSHLEQSLIAEARHYWILDLIDKVVAGTRDKSGSLQKISDVWGIPKGEILYVGDTVYDVREAKKVGILSAGISHGYHTRERLRAENPDFLLDGLKDLITIPALS